MAGDKALRMADSSREFFTPTLHTQLDMEMILQAIATMDAGFGLSASTCTVAGQCSSRTLQSAPPPGPNFNTNTIASASTTLMIRNVPIRYDVEELLLEWADSGIDFIHLPWNEEAQNNESYVFVNFVSDTAALRFTKLWHKQRLRWYTSRKPLNVSFADVQGLADNLRALRRRRVNPDLCKAVVFENGQRLALREALQRAWPRGKKGAAAPLPEHRTRRVLARQTQLTMSRSGLATHVTCQSFSL